MPKKYTANDRLKFRKFLRQPAERINVNVKEMAQFPWENAEDAANLEAI